MQIGESVGQDLVDGGFSAAGRSDQHDSVTNDHRLVELNDFFDDDVFRLEFAVDLSLIDGRLHDAVVVLGKNDAREQILQDSLGSRKRKIETRFIFRYVLASLYEVVSVRPSVGRSVRPSVPV